jgi:hypothetical protein
MLAPQKDVRDNACAASAAALIAIADGRHASLAAAHFALIPRRKGYRFPTEMPSRSCRTVDSRRKERRSGALKRKKIYSDACMTAQIDVLSR